MLADYFGWPDLCAEETNETLSTQRSGGLLHLEPNMSALSESQEGVPFLRAVPQIVQQGVSVGVSGPSATHRGNAAAASAYGAFAVAPAPPWQRSLTNARWAEKDDRMTARGERWTREWRVRMILLSHLQAGFARRSVLRSLLTASPVRIRPVSCVRRLCQMQGPAQHVGRPAAPNAHRAGSSLSCARGGLHRRRRCGRARQMAW